jgi:hypothetical protein
MKDSLSANFLGGAVTADAKPKATFMPVSRSAAVK